MNNKSVFCDICQHRYKAGTGLGVHKRSAHGIPGKTAKTVPATIRVDTPDIVGILPNTKASLQYEVMPFIVVSGNGHVWLVPTDRAELIR